MMANPVGFEGANHVLFAPKDMTQEKCRDLECYKDDTQVISCWRLTESEIDQITETGVIWCAVLSNVIPPMKISGEAMMMVGDRPAQAEPYVPPAKRLDK